MTRSKIRVARSAGRAVGIFARATTLPIHAPDAVAQPEATVEA